MSTEQNLELVRRRFAEHPILGEVEDSLGALYSPDLVLHGPGEQFVGIEGLSRASEETRAAFSDIEFSVESMHPRGEDRVVTTIVGRSRHTGEFRGVPPSGRWVTVRGVIVTLIREQKIVEEWRNMTWTLDQPEK